MLPPARALGSLGRGEPSAGKGSGVCALFPSVGASGFSSVVGRRGRPDHLSGQQDVYACGLTDTSPAAHFIGERAQAQGKEVSVLDHAVKEQQSQNPIFSFRSCCVPGPSLWDPAEFSEPGKPQPPRSGSTDLDALYFRGIILQAESKKENEEVKLLLFPFWPGLVGDGDPAGF